MKKEKYNLHICFICDRAYPLFTNAKFNGIGGVETRSLKLAEMMGKVFRKVSFALRNTGADIVNDHGLNVVPYKPAVISNAPNYDLAKIDADVYIVFESHYLTADAVRTCNIIQKPVIFWATSNRDFNEMYKMNVYERCERGRVGRESAYCLYMANHIICQTEDQQLQLKLIHHLNSTVIRNPINVNSYKSSNNESSHREGILWIGRADPLNKRPSILLEIAKELPNTNFSMVLNNSDDEVFKGIVELKSENVEVIEYVEPNKIDELFMSKSLLVSTSSKEYEGFPNVFLQAIKYGLPIVSLEVDPDGMFSKHRCGICCNGSQSEMVAAIESLNNSEKKGEINRRAFRYLEKYHSSELISKQMVDLLRSNKLNENITMKWTEYYYDRVNAELQNSYAELQNSYAELQNSYAELQNSYAELQRSFSYRIGRRITWLPRKTRGLLQDIVGPNK